MSVVMTALAAIPSIVAAVAAFAFLIIVHELGHALAARAVGMTIVRFSVGYGKVLGSFRVGRTQIALSAVPVGGYVWIGGMIPEDGVDPAAPHAWNNQHAWRRTVAIAAGPVASYVGAVVVAAVLFVSIGVPLPGAFVGEVQAGSAAAQAGLQTGDQIVSVDGTPATDFMAMAGVIRRNPGRPIPVVVERGAGPAAERLTLTLTPRDEGGRGRGGFGSQDRLERRPLGTALVEALVLTNAKMVEQLHGIGRLFQGKAKASELSGPADILRTLAKGARVGAGVFLNLIWVLSVALAVLNLLPIPPLDGGKLAFLLWELATGRRAGERVEMAASWVGFLLLATLILGVTLFGDLPKLFR